MAWSSSRPVTVDHTKVGAGGPHANFVVRVKATATDLKSVANLGLVRADAFDVAFFADALLTTALVFERVSHDVAAGAIYYAVQIPSLSSAVDTVFYLAYGNPSQATDLANKSGTWASGIYDEAFHGAMDGSGNLIGVRGTVLAPGGTTPTNVAGLLGSAVYYSSGFSAHSATPGTGHAEPQAIFACFKPDALANGTPVCLPDPGNGTNTIAPYELSVRATGAVRATRSTTATAIDVDSVTPRLYTAGAWHSAVALFTSTTSRDLYLNGVEGPAAPNTTALTGDTPTGIALGMRRASAGFVNPYVGLLEEVLFYKIAPTAGWILTEHNATIGWATFLTVGAAGTPPAPPVATVPKQPIGLKAFRNDGGTGVQRVIAPVPFPVGMVVSTDLPSATLWSVATGLQVACVILDTDGARHLGSANPGSLKYAVLEFDHTFATLNDVGLYTLKWDQPKTTTDLVAQDTSTFVGAVNFGFSTTGFQFRNLAALPYAHASDDLLRTAAVQDIQWGNRAFDLQAIPAGTYAVFAVTADINGVLTAWRVNDGLTGTAQPANYYPTNPPEVWHAIGGAAAASQQPVAYVYVGSSSGSLTLVQSGGVAANRIDAGNANAWATVTANAANKPFSVVLSDMPIASHMPSSAAYFASCAFFLQTAKTQAEVNALGTRYAAVLTNHVAGSDSHWYSLGKMAPRGSAFYDAPMTELSLAISTVGLRFYRRAMQYGWTVNDYEARIAAYTPGEPERDAAALLWWGTLARVRATAKATAVKVSSLGEYGMLTAAVGYQGGRSGMHAAWAFQVADVLGYGQLANGLGGLGTGDSYVLGSVGGDKTNWPDAADGHLDVVTSNRDRFLRLLSRFLTYMVSAELGPFATAPQNIGRRFFRLRDYDFGPFDAGVGWFMLGHIFHALVWGLQVYAVTPSAAVIAMVRDTLEFGFSGVSPLTGLPMYRSSPREQFTYSAPGSYLGDAGAAHTTLATGMTSYADATLALTDIHGGGLFEVYHQNEDLVAATGMLHVFDAGGVHNTFFRYTGPTAIGAAGPGSLTGVTYLSGDQFAYGAGATVRRVITDEPAGATLNGFHVDLFAWLWRWTGNATWLVRLATLYQAMDAATLIYNYKEVSESAVYSWRSLVDRELPTAVLSGLLDRRRRRAAGV